MRKSSSSPVNGGFSAAVEAIEIVDLPIENGEFP